MKQEKFMVTFQIFFSLISWNDLKMTEKVFSPIGCAMNDKMKVWRLLEWQKMS
jgi:hypothetical protein